MIVENVVAQSLVSKGDSLYFYKEVDKNQKRQLMEVDFLIRQNNKVCPIEVKSSKVYKYKSLELFKQKYSAKIGTQYILYDGDIKREGKIVYLPYYMVICL